MTYYSINSSTIFRSIMIIAVSFTCLLIINSDQANARRDDGERNRSEFYGVIQSRPENGLIGAWSIGGRKFITDSGTEFDQSEGDLFPGDCAKVKIRNGRVHEIDSEPIHDCR